MPRLDTPDCKRMVAIMKKHGWTQADLAKAIGISQGAINEEAYKQATELAYKNRMTLSKWIESLILAAIDKSQRKKSS
jgi:transcriptional regulator with XRE-family HTH domain